MSLLKDKAGYEYWLLDYIGNVSVELLGKGVINKYIFRDDSIGVTAHINAYDSLFGSAKADLLNNINPLLLTASYKIIDMVFEWVLTENYDAGIFKDVPKSGKWKSPSTWKFIDKIERLSDNNIKYPPIMQLDNFLINYYYSLYENLLQFRNQIVHRNGFSVEGGTLRVKLDDGESLILGPSQLDSLMKVSAFLIPVITEDCKLGPYQRALIRYHLDQLAETHRLPPFGDRCPLLFNVEYHVHQNNGVFTIDLARVRKRLGETGRDREIHFNLDVVKFIDDEQVDKCSITNDMVPDTDELVLPGVGTI